MKEQKKIWIVGGSSGIGLEFVKKCLTSSYKVIVSSRNACSNDILLSLKKKYNKNIHLIDLDVTSSETILSCVEEAWNVYDGIDTWFYNAGAYEIMNINSWSTEHFEKMNEVNYLGVIRIMNELVPYFKKQKKGHFVWNASISSYFGLPLGGGYSAPKAALLNLAQSIYPELQLANIDLQIVNHGFVKTRLTDQNEFEMPQLMQPKYAAEKIFQKMQNQSNFEIRFPLFLSLFLRVLSLLPYKLSLAITKKMLP